MALVRAKHPLDKGLGSNYVITDAAGAVVQELSFDPWGQRRNASAWHGLYASQLTGFDSSRTHRGFTGHEHLDALDIVHMNGRSYDPQLARFLQADPNVQAPAYTQSHNRYSYVLNNPLNATDPTGFVCSGSHDGPVTCLPPPFPPLPPPCIGGFGHSANAGPSPASLASLPSPRCV